ncbi:hypothetical protein ACA910_008351 [Epithemia clementina (nom. ined.)]
MSAKEYRAYLDAKADNHGRPKADAPFLTNIEQMDGDSKNDFRGVADEVELVDLEDNSYCDGEDEKADHKVGDCNRNDGSDRSEYEFMTLYEEESEKNNDNQSSSVDVSSSVGLSQITESDYTHTRSRTSLKRAASHQTTLGGQSKKGRLSRKSQVNLTGDNDEETE